MDIHTLDTNLPVLLLYNINPTWPLDDIESCHQVAHTFGEALNRQGHPVTKACLQDRDLEALLSRFDPDDFVVLNWCEELPGIPHSYHLIARILEELGFTFTGADSRALSFSQDKRKIKAALDALGVDTPRWRIFNSTGLDGWSIYPAIVKPALEHCSYGITSEAVVRSPVELTGRVRFVLENFHQPALVEEFIDGREFHVTVIGNGELHILPPAEMDFSAFGDMSDRLCTYESKFDPLSRPYNMIRLNIPAPLTEKERKRLIKTALAGYRAVDCRDYARLDIRLRDGIFYVLDVNPNADISPDTSLALAAEQAGFSYGQLGSWLVNLASKRHPVFGASIRAAMQVQ